MLNCLYTEEEERFRAETQKFVKAEISPHAEEIEKGKYPRELLRLLGKKGLLGLTHLKRYGGQERGWVYETILASEVGAANAALDMARGATCILYGTPISKFGTDVQREKYLKPVLSGEKLGCIGITEPLVGSDTAGMQTTAVKNEAEKCWVINGEKRFITNGSEADYICLFAITNKKVSSHQGMSAFIFPTNTPGFKVIKVYDLLGMRGTRTAHLQFENCRIPLENLVGKENAGFQILMDELDTERTMYAGTLYGIAKAAFEVASTYSTSRIQFGKPIAQFEGVSFKVADMAIKLEAIDTLILRAARLCDLKVPATKETAIAKIAAGDFGFEVCADAVQILGGVGYTTEYPVERYMRDVKLGMIGAGSSEILRFLIQREVYKNLEKTESNRFLFYSDEENQLRQKVKEFASREVVPHLDEIAKGQYSRTLLKKMGAEGYLGYTHPKRYGGLEKGWVQESIIAEEIARASGAANMIRGGSALLFAKPIKKFGSEEQREKILPKIIKGEKIGALGVTEPNAGSDISAIQTIATRKGGTYVLNGEKRFITNGGVADYILVFALTSTKPTSPRNSMSCYIVPTDSAGFKVEKVYNLHGMRGINAAHLKFTNCEIPLENRVGEENQGYPIMMDQFDTERLIFASTLLGVMQAAFNIAVKYSMNRVQFNQPISQFEGINFKIADMAINIEATEALILKTARLIDLGQQVPMLSAITRVFASDYGFKVCDDALQVLGGIGYTDEYPVEQLFRDIRLGRIGAGTSEVLRFLIQREIYKKMGK